MKPGLTAYTDQFQSRETDHLRPGCRSSSGCALTSVCIRYETRGLWSALDQAACRTAPARRSWGGAGDLLGLDRVRNVLFICDHILMLSRSFLYQMVHLSKQEADARLGGLTALAKAKAGMVVKVCAECAVLLHGGNGYTESGQGALIAMISRDVAGARIPGGSEDVMLDLSIRELYKQYQRALGRDARL